MKERTRKDTLQGFILQGVMTTNKRLYFLTVVSVTLCFLFVSYLFGNICKLRIGLIYLLKYVYLPPSFVCFYLFIHLFIVILISFFFALPFPFLGSGPFVSVEQDTGGL